MKKFIKSSIVFALLLTTVQLSSCAISDEPCEYCGDTPTRGYKTSKDTTFYVCSDCSSECALCSGKATEHYTNLLGMEMFVCSDCYESVSR